MTKKINNELDIEGNIQAEGDLNVGNTIEKQEFNFTINQGPSEQQLKEIIRTETELALKQQQILAEDKAREKLSNFSDKVLPKLVKSEMLDAFSDPTIQMFYRTAQQTAICSERDIDYDVLSELLVYRINNKGNISKKASITKAAEIIDKISDAALLALTIKYCNNFIPLSGKIQEGLKTLDDMYKKILSGNELPVDDDWIDNIEILGVARIESTSKMKKFEDILFIKLKGYFSKGIEKNSKFFEETIEKLTANKIPMNIFVEHELNPNHMRIAVANKESIKNFYFKNNINDYIPISEKQKNILEEIWNCYQNDNSCEQIIKEAFCNKIKEFTYLNKVIEWWNQNLKPVLVINSIGRVLAHTNAKRLYENIPDMV